MLARKGYSAGLAYSVVREAIERAGQDTADHDELFEADKVTEGD